MYETELYGCKVGMDGGELVTNGPARAKVKPGVKDSDKEGSRKPLSRDNNAWTGLEQETEVWLRTY